MLDKAEKRLEELYIKALTAGNSRLAFLKALNDYVGYTKSEAVLVKLTVSLREEYARESILDIQKALHDPVFRELLQMRDAVEGSSNTFPFNDYRMYL